MAALLSEESLGGVQEGMHLQCLSPVGRRGLHLRLGTEEPLPSLRSHQFSGSRQAPEIPCQWCGEMAPLTVTCSQDWPRTLGGGAWSGG